jgi:chromate reductase
VFLDTPAMQQPEAYIGGVDKLFDTADRIAEPGTRDLLSRFLRPFEWITRQAVAYTA